MHLAYALTKETVASIKKNEIKSSLTEWRHRHL